MAWSESLFTGFCGTYLISPSNDDLSHVPKNVSTIVDLLDTQGISWGAYQEDLPFSGFEANFVNQRTRANDYVRKHNPPSKY